MKRRVVITGIGVVTPIGLDVPSFWGGIVEGRSGGARVTQFDCGELRTQIAAEVVGFDPEKTIPDRKLLRNLDRFTQFALVASVEAMRAAQLDANSVQAERAGVVIGSGIGGLHEIEEQARVLFDRGPTRISPFFIPKMMVNAAAGQLAIQHGFKGPNFTTASACASSQHALGVSLQLIRSGACDVMLTGGSESTITPLGMGGFCAAKAMTVRNDTPTTASRPFSGSRDGFLMGEGAAILVFEEEQRARKRGVPIYAEVLGFGMTDDSHHITAPSPDGAMAAAAMAGAAADAAVALERVNYINAHGTSTPLNDAMESRAIRRLFGSHADRLMVSSTKSQIGHLLGASGAVELAAVVLGIHRGVVPPTINYQDPDPDCDLDYVPNEARAAAIDVALSNSFGFGGHNACLCVGRYAG
ncbi:MAG: beta-ketoacyl-ACP synthase II [Planctomycetota bacterium]